MRTLLAMLAIILASVFVSSTAQAGPAARANKSPITIVASVDPPSFYLIDTTFHLCFYVSYVNMGTAAIRVPCAPFTVHVPEIAGFYDKCQ